MDNNCVVTKMVGCRHKDHLIRLMFLPTLEISLALVQMVKWYKACAFFNRCLLIATIVIYCFSRA